MYGIRFETVTLNYSKPLSDVTDFVTSWNLLALLFSVLLRLTICIKQIANLIHDVTNILSSLRNLSHNWYYSMFYLLCMCMLYIVVVLVIMRCAFVVQKMWNSWAVISITCTYCPVPVHIHYVISTVAINLVLNCVVIIVQYKMLC